MTKTSVYRDKLFTVEEANRTLPLVTAIVSDLVDRSLQVMERRQRLQELTARGGSHTSGSNDPYAEEMDQIQTELEQDIREIAVYEEELRELGVESKNGADGIVGFPAMIDGEIVHLCWKLGESELGHWHRIGETYSERQPLSDEPTGNAEDSLDG